VNLGPVAPFWCPFQFRIVVTEFCRFFLLLAVLCRLVGPVATVVTRIKRDTYQVGIEPVEEPTGDISADYN
jgi:hypothetical protein